MLPHGFHWLDDKCRLLLRGRALVLIEPTASPVSLSVLVPGEPPTSKYFVSHELAIAYAERWATKHEAGIRLHVPHAQGATAMA